MDKKLVALTFDDGPSDTTSDLVMDQLEKYNIPATFFLIGIMIHIKTVVIGLKNGVVNIRSVKFKPARKITVSFLD